MAGVRRKLGEILVEDYRVPREDLDAALANQRHGVERLGALLVRMGALTERDLVTALGQQLGLPVVLGLPRLEVSDVVLVLVPMRLAETKLVIPIEADDGELVLAMADPTDGETIRSLEGLAGLTVRPCIAPEEDVRRALKVFYFKEPLHRDLEEITGAFERMRRQLHDELSMSGPSLTRPSASASADLELVEVSLGAPIPIAPAEGGSTAV